MSIHLCQQSSIALDLRRRRILFLNALATLIALAMEEQQSRAALIELVAKHCGLDFSTAEEYADRVQRELWGGNAEPAGWSGEASIFRWRMEHPSAAEPVEIRTYRLLGKSLTCRYMDRASLELAGDAFAHLEEQALEVATASIEVQIRDDLVRVARGSQRLEDAVDPTSLVNLLRLVLAETAFASSGEEWAVHAAAVARDGRAVLLPGPSGKGKSTLAFGLGLVGFKIMGDDTLVLATDTLDVIAVPFPLCLKRGAWTLAKEQLGEVGRQHIDGRRLDGAPVRWLPQSAGANLSGSDARAAVQHIVFPAFVEGAAVKVTQLCHDEALERLLPGLHPLGTGLTAEKIERLIAWVGSKPCSEVRYGRLDDGVRAVADLFS